MNTKQAAYAVAKAKLDAANELFNEYMTPFEYLFDLDTEEGNRAYSAKITEFGSQLNIKELAANLHKAEDEMVVWANAKVSKSKHFNAAHKQAMSEIAANMHRLSIRKKMIELAFRLG